MKKNQYQNDVSGSSTVFAAKEAYRTVRTNLMFSLAKKGCKTILFTSSLQGEGKTTTCANVAFSIARNNKRVLLLDVDLRKPHLHRLVKLPSSPGLTNYLSGFSTLEEVIHKDIFPNMDVICAGTLSPNPSEMVASESFEKLLKKLQASYDFIIIDTPPVNLVSDALTVMPFADGVVLVVRPNYTVRKEVQKAVDQIRFVDGKILGVVANAVAVEKKRGYYSRYGRYGYGTYGASQGAVRENGEEKAALPKEEKAEAANEEKAE